nr:hypothetical protein [Candidatus Freyarchaeota archaeon]
MSDEKKRNLRFEHEWDSPSNSENEFTVEGEWDNRNAIFFAKMAVEEARKLYGPIFPRMASRYALEFESRMLKEKPPENIQGLEEVTNYIIANLDRYPNGCSALSYGIFKAESKLQGSTGAGAKRVAYGAMKSILESSGILNSVVGTTEDVFEAYKKFTDSVRSTKVVILTRVIRKENNQVVVVFHDCPFKEACRAFVDEGISRMIGGWECIALIIVNVGIEIITKNTLDYKLEEFDKPNCRGRVWEV